MTDRATTSAQPSDDELRRRHLQVYGHLAQKLLAVHGVEPRLLTGRQPLTELDARELARHGVTHVLDLREEREWSAPGRHGADALSELAALGIERLALPIADGEAPDPATLDLAVEFLDRATGRAGSAGRAYVHCRAGIERTGTVILAFRAWRDDQSVDRALDALTGPESPFSPLPWQVDAVRRWLATRRGQASRLES